MEHKILLIGGGGHCHSVLDILMSGGVYDRIGIVAKDEANYQELQNDILTAPFLAGIDDELPKLLSEGWQDAFVTLGSVGNTVGRRQIFDNLLKIGFGIPIIKDKSAIVSKSSIIGRGALIGKNAVINAGSRIDQCAIINTGAIIEHDCEIGEFAHVSPGAILCGGVTVGRDSHIGAGSTVIQGITIGKAALIGAGSVVVKNIPDGVKAYGNPCKAVI